MTKNPAVEPATVSGTKPRTVYKAIMSDLDGTVINSPAQRLASDRMRSVIGRLQDAGISFSAVTGRPATFARPVIESMGLTSPCVVAGGTKIIDPATFEELWINYIPVISMDSIRDLLSASAYGCLWNDYESQDYENGGWPLRQLDEKTPVHFFEVCYVPTEKAHELAKRLNAMDEVNASVVAAHRKGTCDLHVTNKKATKEHAIYEVEQMIAVNRSQMIGIGDGHNDLHLFSAVGYKVAMGNAVDDLKKAADEVIGDVKNDGLAVYLEEKVKEWV